MVYLKRVMHACPAHVARMKQCMVLERVYAIHSTRIPLQGGCGKCVLMLFDTAWHMQCMSRGYIAMSFLCFGNYVVALIQ